MVKTMDNKEKDNKEHEQCEHPFCLIKNKLLRRFHRIKELELLVIKRHFEIQHCIKEKRSNEISEEMKDVNLQMNVIANQYNDFIIDIAERIYDCENGKQTK